MSCFDELQCPLSTACIALTQPAIAGIAPSPNDNGIRKVEICLSLKQSAVEIGGDEISHESVGKGRRLPRHAETIQHVIPYWQHAEPLFRIQNAERPGSPSAPGGEPFSARFRRSSPSRGGGGSLRSRSARCGAGQTRSSFMLKPPSRPWPETDPSTPQTHLGTAVDPVIPQALSSLAGPIASGTHRPQSQAGH